MNRIGIVAMLALSLIGTAACGNASPDRTRSGTGISGGSLTGGTPVDGAAIGTVPDGAVGAPASQNRIHIGKPLGED